MTDIKNDLRTPNTEKAHSDTHKAVQRSLNISEADKKYTEKLVNFYEKECDGYVPPAL